MDGRRLIKLFILLIPLVFYSEQSRADAFQQTGSVRISAEYDSNPAMATAYRESVWRALLDPSYTLTRRDSGYELNGGFALHVARSSNRTLSQNRNDPSVFVDLRHPLKTGLIMVAARYDEVSTRIAEIDITGPNTVDSTRASRTVSGNLSKELSERSTFSINGAYSDVTYKGGGYLNYTSRSASPMLNYAMSEHSSTFFNATYTDSDTAIAYTRMINALLGWNWQASEYLEATLDAGKFKLSGANHLGTLGMAEVKLTGQQTALVLHAGREVTPSGQGSFVIVDRAKGDWSYAFSENSKCGVNVEWRKSWLGYYIYNTNTGAWLQHRLNSLWDMRTYYSHRTSDQAGFGNASSNLLGISFVYNQTDF